MRGFHSAISVGCRRQVGHAVCPWEAQKKTKTLSKGWMEDERSWFGVPQTQAGYLSVTFKASVSLIGGAAEHPACVGLSNRLT